MTKLTLHIADTKELNDHARASAVFEATFVEVDKDKRLRSVQIQDVLGSWDGQEIYIKEQFLDYMGSAMGFIDRLYPGEVIEFSAIPKLYKDKQGNDQWCLTNVKKFKRF